MVQVLVNVQSYRIEKLQSYWAFSAMAKILPKTAPAQTHSEASQTHSEASQTRSVVWLL